MCGGKGIMAIKDEYKTMVIFRVYPDGDVIALFPCQDADILGRYCTSYEHIGQHGSADYEYVLSITRPASAKEAAPLVKELDGLGYNLAMRQRAPVWHYKDKWIAMGNG